MREDKKGDSVLRQVIRVSRIPVDGVEHAVSLNAEQLAILAQELELEALERLQGKVTVMRWGAGGAVVSGKLTADIVQQCVASLEPLPSTLEVSFERRFASESASVEYLDGELIIDPEADDEPDLLEQDAIDLWEIVREELVLCIDPYPRKADFVLTAPQESVIDTPDTETRRPFADLGDRLAEKNNRNN